jgi:hypothetical protein
MVAAAGQDSSLKLQVASNGELSIAEKRLKIISSFRSKDYQAQLRRQSPNAGRAGLALNSPHFTGRALDLYVGGEPVDTRDSNRSIQVNTLVYKWLVKTPRASAFILTITNLGTGNTSRPAAHPLVHLRPPSL